MGGSFFFFSLLSPVPPPPLVKLPPPFSPSPHPLPCRPIPLSLPAFFLSPHFLFSLVARLSISLLSISCPLPPPPPLRVPPPLFLSFPSLLPLFLLSCLHFVITFPLSHLCPLQSLHTVLSLLPFLLCVYFSTFSPIFPFPPFLLLSLSSYLSSFCSPFPPSSPFHP